MEPSLHFKIMMWSMIILLQAKAQGCITLIQLLQKLFCFEQNSVKKAQKFIVSKQKHETITYNVIICIKLYSPSNCITAIQMMLHVFLSCIFFLGTIGCKEFKMDGTFHLFVFCDTLSICNFSLLFFSGILAYKKRDSSFWNYQLSMYWTAYIFLI